MEKYKLWLMKLDIFFEMLALEYANTNNVQECCCANLSNYVVSRPIHNRQHRNRQLHNRQLQNRQLHNHNMLWSVTHNYWMSLQWNCLEEETGQYLGNWKIFLYCVFVFHWVFFGNVLCTIVHSVNVTWTVYSEKNGRSTSSVYVYIYAFNYLYTI